MTEVQSSSRTNYDDEMWKPRALLVAASHGLGCVMLLTSFLQQRWFAIPMPEGGEAFIPFSSLDDMYYMRATTGFRSHFEQLAWMCGLLAAVGAGGWFVRGRAGVLLAWLGAATSIAALGLIAYEMRVTDGLSYATWFGYADRGLWFAVAGFIVLGGTAIAGTTFCVFDKTVQRRQRVWVSA